MPNPVLVPFQAEHLRYLINRDTGICDPWAMALQKMSGPALTAIDDGVVIGCAGIVVAWPGVGMAWMVLDAHIDQHGAWMTKMVRRFLNDAINYYRLHRIEAVVFADNSRNQRWIERLGFTRENGSARAYTQDQRDMIRYEWVKGGSLWPS